MKGRVFSGARPTGRQHIGNYLGAIQNYIALQEEYECIYCIVDIHALTTLSDPDELRQNIREMMLDWLAAGLDPRRSILFVQSHVPEVMELFTMLGMVTPLGWLTRVATFKEKARQQPENINYGLVGYPVLMTADILMYKASVVPVGEDQLPHLELAREVVRRFNIIYGPTFPEPQDKMTTAPLIIGLDGVNKMSKSLNNDIELAATPKETLDKIKGAFTDPNRKRRNDPGNPKMCNIWKLHHHFNPGDVETIAVECREAGRGCVDCKIQLAEAVNEALKPFRERREKLAADMDYVIGVYEEGAERARSIAVETLREVKERMGLL
ncbi:MAG: tryptophan--tRNA ligase [Chloroflexota bacterium]|nr:tryptophan--tRNA ligase [Chloroflexota bacterium]